MYEIIGNILFYLSLIFKFSSWEYVLIPYLLAFAAGIFYRKMHAMFAQDRPYNLIKNINAADRLKRAKFGFILLLLAIVAAWNPAILFLSGFFFFEAATGWCGVYAFSGKNTYNEK